MSRFVYLVNGSEDGLMGVYGSVSKAQARVLEYLKEYQPSAHELAQFAAMCSDIRKGKAYFTRFEVEHREIGKCSASIEASEVQ